MFGMARVAAPCKPRYPQRPRTFRFWPHALSAVVAVPNKYAYVLQYNMYIFTILNDKFTFI